MIVTMRNMTASLPAFFTAFILILLVLASVLCWIAFVMLMAKSSVDKGVRFDVIRTVIPIAVPAPAAYAPWTVCAKPCSSSIPRIKLKQLLGILVGLRRGRCLKYIASM